MVDKRREKQLERIREKHDKQMSPEEMKQQRIITKKQLEITIPTKEAEIKYMEKQLESGRITFKDEQFVDNLMPPYKLEHMIASSRLQIDDFKKAYKEVCELIKNDRTESDSGKTTNKH